MKYSIKNLLLSCALLLAASLTVGAQTTYSGYFLEGYDYRYQMNPAIGNETMVVAMPAIGNFNVATHGSLNLKNIIYTLNGKTVLFTNPGISTSEVMSHVKDRNRLGLNTKIDLMSVGFKALGGYNVVSLSALANVETSVPGAFFSLAKEGLTNTTYDISNMFANVNAYGQIALNHSRDIKKVPGLRVGATLKVLVGVGNVDFDFKNAHLQLDENEWIAQTNADVYASVGGLRFDKKTSEKTGRDYVSGANLDGGFAPNGFGLGFDLGAEYKWRDFNFSLAILDFGFMSWGKTQHASTNGPHTVNTGAFTFNASGSAPNSFSNEWDRLSKDLEELYQLRDMGALSSRTKMLGATLNVGASYELPAYRKLHFGLLSTTRINGKYSWTQVRLSANVRPVKLLSVDINGVVGTFSGGFGWLFNFHAPGFNLFAGMDYTLGKLSKQGVPLNSNSAFNFGLNFPLK
ncbi:MAG: hypothetical protein J1F05_06820 [Muribaculaceae bacterium]|nr:hypothetical protein [Muribaculaceae bacterium]